MSRPGRRAASTPTRSATRPSSGLRGHVVEIDFEPGYTNWRSEQHTPRSLIDARTIKTPTDKKIVNLVQKLAKRADRVTIATDFDTEGELIGKETYDLVRAARPDVPVARARFSAITPQEIKTAFARTAELDFALAAAGEARQVIDLIWGASLTRFISLAARRGGKNILSVGRVQSPTLAMIVDREREIEAFVPEPYWVLTVDSERGGAAFTARHTTNRFTDREAAEAARDRTAPPLVVTDSREGSKQDRAPPRSTRPSSSWPRAGSASRPRTRCGSPRTCTCTGSSRTRARTTPSIPPSLELDGILGTLARTEFATTSPGCRPTAAPTPTRGKKSSTDHPPIHPAGAATRAELGDERWRLYELVVRRFLATLSPDARWTTRKVLFEAGGEPYTTTGATLAEPGWRTVYPYWAATENALPPFAVGDRLPVEDVKLEEKETQPPPRYTQSRLIQEMEELGLGHQVHPARGDREARRPEVHRGNPPPPDPGGPGRDRVPRGPCGCDHPARDDDRDRRAHAGDQGPAAEPGRGRGRVAGHAPPGLRPARGPRRGDWARHHGQDRRGADPRPLPGLRPRSPPPSRPLEPVHRLQRLPRVPVQHRPAGHAWGFAIRTDDVCATHGLAHVRLLAKGARPGTSAARSATTSNPTARPWP